MFLLNSISESSRLFNTGKSPWKYGGCLSYWPSYTWQKHKPILRWLSLQPVGAFSSKVTGLSEVSCGKAQDGQQNYLRKLPCASSPWHLTVINPLHFVLLSEHSKKRRFQACEGRQKLFIKIFWISTSPWWCHLDHNKLGTPWGTSLSEENGVDVS